MRLGSHWQAGPACWLRRVAAQIRISQRIPTMVSLKGYSLGGFIVHKFRAPDCVWRRTVLDPGDQRCEHIFIRRKPNSCCGGISSLPNNPRPRTRITVEHARYTEETEEFVEIRCRCLHSSHKTIVEARCVEGCNLVVLLAVKREYLTTFGLESSERVWPGSDVAWIQSFGSGSILEVERRRVPVGVTVDNIFEPVLQILLACVTHRESLNADVHLSKKMAFRRITFAQHTLHFPAASPGRSAHRLHHRKD